MQWWQHIPEMLNPIAFSIGFFSVYWYAIFFLGGFCVTLFVALYLVRKGEIAYSQETILDVLFVLFFGALIGGHLGYILFYNLSAFLETPALLLPYDFEHGQWVGIAGMSFFGGLIGAGIALFWFTQKKRIDFWKLADTLVFLVPISLFFGRLGNFFNAELYGRVTEQPWGMVFPGVVPLGMLRHPSTLYEAFFEGVALFVILFIIRKRALFSGELTCIFIGGYAFLRFFMEYFREPDSQLGFLVGSSNCGLTLGQILSLIAFFVSVTLFVWLQRKNHGILTK